MAHPTDYIFIYMNLSLYINTAECSNTQVLSCLLAEQDKCMEGTIWKCHAHNNESQCHKIWWGAVQCAKLDPVITWFSFHKFLHLYKCNEYRDKYLHMQSDNFWEFIS